VKKIITMIALVSMLGLVLASGASSAIIIGTTGADVIYGTDEGDVIRAKRGNDTIAPGRGYDLVLAGKGRDVINIVLGGHDRARCGPGPDTVSADRADRVSHMCERVFWHPAGTSDDDD
jgi:Ca2+-binding RTX toxin-like protein